MLINNALGLNKYPFGQRDVHDLIGSNSRSDLQGKLWPTRYTRSHDLTSNSLQDIREIVLLTQDPNQDSIPDLAEVFLGDHISLHPEVLDELPALEDFYRSLEETLPLPKDDDPDCIEALNDVKGILPVVYGSVQSE